jgi:hypothetical protein
MKWVLFRFRNKPGKFEHVVGGDDNNSDRRIMAFEQSLWPRPLNSLYPNFNFILEFL